MEASEREVDQERRGHAEAALKVGLSRGAQTPLVKASGFSTHHGVRPCTFKPLAHGALRL